MQIINIGLSPSYHPYEIAGLNYLINFKYHEVEPFLIDDPVFKKTTIKTELTFNKLIYSKTTLIGENNYQLQVKTNHKHQFQLIIDDNEIVVSQQSISTDSSELAPTLLFGPALILNLALNQIYCFHASCFEYKKCVFIVLGQSGTGKSTIAEYFQRQFNSRIADDIVALKKINTQINVLAKFPQLKLSPLQQCNKSAINKKTFLLFAKQSQHQTRLKKLKNFNALKSTISHSVASKIFDANLLKDHLSFCNDLVSFSHSYELLYQHSNSSLTHLCNLLDEIV